MNLLVSLLLFVSLSVPAVSGTDDPMREHWLSFIEKYYTTKQSAKDYKAILGRQNPDGSWSEVDYKSKLRGSWAAGKHADYFASLASAYYETGDTLARDAALKALEYWGRTKPVASNWWWNVIGVPRRMAPGFYILKNDLDEQHLSWALEVMDKSPFGMTGQNKVWRAENVFFRALLVDDKEMMAAARDTIASEIVQVTPDKEGIQLDWSFHQHGPQLQFGNYGMSYAGAMSWWVMGFRGTEYEFSPEQVAIITNYVKEGSRWPSWNGYYDHSACGRQVFRNQQRSKASASRQACQRLLLSPEPEESGSRYYPYSDFGIYRSDDWYSSIRMQSRSVCGMETTNSENMKCYFASDGALLTRISGDEYFNVSPCWNWKHIPGATTYDDGKELWGLGPRKKGGFENNPYNDTDLVFGKADGEYMVAAMDYVRDGMTARKAYFFTPEGVVCLGAGISREAADPVVTTLEQNVLKGEVESGKGWISHRGITYVVLDGHRIKTADPLHKGNWHWIAPFEKDKEISMNLFDAWIEHGKSPKDASYAYVVAPSCSACDAEGAARAKIVKKQVKVLSNTPTLQKVSVAGKVMTIDWNNREILM